MMRRGFRSAFWRRAVLAFVGLALAAPVPALAQVIKAQTPWIILRSEMDQGSLDVKSGDTVLQSRVVPMGLATLDEDMIAPGKDEPLLHKGDQLFRLFVADTRRIYCSIHPRKGQLADILLIRIPDTYVCGIDADADGRFDSFYLLRTKNSTSLPVFTVAKREGTAIGTPIAYRSVNPREFADEYLFRILYTGKPMFGKKPAFGITFGPKKNQLMLTARGAVDMKSDDHGVSLGGARFKLDSVSDGTAHLTIERGIPTQPFTLYIPPPRIIFVAY